MSTTGGWDIGGAHLKLALAEHGEITEARQIACPLWQGIDQLRAALRTALADRSPPDWNAVTMTGELADCFPDRATGVSQILGILGEFVATDGISVYASSGTFLTVAEALASPGLVASANWHATTRLAAAELGNGLLLDIGSTTTDIVPFRDGRLAARGLDDAGRLATGELVYTGIARTPLAAVSPYFPFAGERVGVMAEYFATMADAYRVAGRLPEDADLHPAADGRGKSVAESRARLARMIGRDAESASAEAWRNLAEAIIRCQLRQIEEACDRVLSGADLPGDAPIVGCGGGRAVAAEIARRLARPYRGFETLIRAFDDIAAAAADHAPAAAVALLLERPSA